MAEWFDLVDAEGNPTGESALRSECHGNPDLLHQAVHVFVVNRAGDLFLQKRSMQKDIQPGKWDTSVGGHVDAGEKPADAVCRELREELGVPKGNPEFLYQYLWRSPVESEVIRSFRFRYDGPFELQASELDDGKFWSLTEIEAHIGKDIFTPNFEFEWPKIRPYLESAPS
ncbi:NUDIX domain-containing protein [Kiritimatiellaeota bacterium B1221]|nr:NUDIX domain-containing protein [Kiritimatiellaeota bacterium B1221]